MIYCLRPKNLIIGSVQWERWRVRIFPSFFIRQYLWKSRVILWKVHRNLALRTIIWDHWEKGHFTWGRRSKKNFSFVKLLYMILSTAYLLQSIGTKADEVEVSFHEVQDHWLPHHLFNTGYFKIIYFHFTWSTTDTLGSFKSTSPFNTGYFRIIDLHIPWSTPDTLGSLTSTPPVQHRILYHHLLPHHLINPGYFRIIYVHITWSTPDTLGSFTSTSPVQHRIL